jgi:hypothetical protein
MNLRKLELYFAGAEVPAWRKLLVQEHVPHVAINYLHLKPRLPKKQWLLADHFPDDQKIFLVSGATSTEKKGWTVSQHEEFLSDYVDFVQQNLERLTFFTEYDAVSLGQDWLSTQRAVWAGLADDKFVPIWHEYQGGPALREIAEHYSNLGVPPVAIRTQNVLSSLVRRTRLNLHGLSFSHPYDAPGGLYSTLLSSSWISPTRFGETVIWDQNRLRRYPADEKDKIRTRHRQHFTQMGFNADAILADAGTEVSRYTIWAWRQMEAHLEAPERVGSTPEGNGRVSDNGSTAVELVGHDHAEVLADGDGRQPLPVFDYRPVTSTIANPDGPGTTAVTSLVAHMGTADLRKCDSCALAVVCSLYEAGSSCKYRIPMEIRNRDQLLGVLYSLLEMQGQRLQFTFLAEQLQGGYPDANLSSELDRFMSMTRSVKDIQDNRDFLKVTVEGRAQTGVLSKLFGEARTETLRRVDPDKAEDVIRRTMQ